MAFLSEPKDADTLWKPSSTPIYLGEKVSMSRDELDAMIRASDAKDVVRINPSEHPWVGSTTLAGAVAKVSPDMAKVLQIKLQQFKDRTGWNIPSRTMQGGGFINPEGIHVKYQIQRMAGKWTFWLAREQVPDQQIWNVPASELVILKIDERQWKLTQHEATLASGQF